MSKFSERLKLLRTEANLSQSELAKTIGISKSSINMYERGEREPRLDTIKIMARYFNVDMNYIIGTSDIRNSDTVIDNEFLQILSTLSDEDKEWLLNVIKSVIDGRKF